MRADHQFSRLDRRGSRRRAEGGGLTEASDPGALAAAKAALRTSALAARKAAAKAAPDAPRRAAARFLAEIRRAPGEIVAGYSPIGSELDPGPLLAALAAEGLALALPVVAAADAPLVFRRWRPGEPLIEGAFGAAIPEQDAPARPSLVVTPLAAFDRRGARLGYGGGFYDRTLARLRAEGGARAIGYAYAAQEAPSVPTEKTDQRLDAVVTEAEIIHPQE